MILAAIEWQGGNGHIIADTVRRLRREGYAVETLLMSADTATEFHRALDHDPPGRLPSSERPVSLYIAAAAGNGQILFSDVPVRPGIRFAQFK